MTDCSTPNSFSLKKGGGNYPFTPLATPLVIVPQKQANLCDCGLFAIANETALAFGTDPSAAKLDVGNMRAHLTKCNVMTLFPQKQ